MISFKPRREKSNPPALADFPTRALFRRPVDHCQPGVIRKPHNLGKLAFRSWVNHQFRLSPADSIAGAPSAKFSFPTIAMNL